MSMAHFEALQQMVNQLQGFGYKDVTDEVKPYYEPHYLYIASKAGMVL